jgi:hypothetical protein
MRGLRSGLLEEPFGCGGLTLANELGQSQLSDVLQENPRPMGILFDYSNGLRTVSNPNLVRVTAMFQLLRFANIFAQTRSSATLPHYGLSMDSLAVCLRFRRGKKHGMRVLRSAQEK